VIDDALKRRFAILQVTLLAAVLFIW